MIRLRQEDGFSTLGMVVALTLSLSLLFTTAQVCRLSSAAAAVQDVADASALAAENQIAEFVIVAKTCDAVVLSLTLTSFASAALGVVCLCTPVTAQLSVQLIELSKKILDARNVFAKKASQGLDSFQTLLPFLSAVHAMQVSKANDGGPSGHRYMALAILGPEEGKAIEAQISEAEQKALDDVDNKADEIRKQAKVAEEAAQEAFQAKEAAFERDCGAYPGYCLYERAESLAGMIGADNPLYSSPDSWSFDVALNRAKAYYAKRLSGEKPASPSVEEQAKSALRKRFYAYAVKAVSAGYVRDDGVTFDANFPRLPRNTDQMKSTSLYTEGGYPISGAGDSRMMHAWEGCPSASGYSSTGSISQMEDGKFVTCPNCAFTAQSMGKVAEASSSIDNGFEYHYLKIADEAQRYQSAREKQKPATATVQDGAGSLLKSLVDAFKEGANKRIKVCPPGSNGVVVLAVDTASVSAAQGFETSFVQGGTVLGTRAAVSGATLLADSSTDGSNIISSLFDEAKERSGALAFAPGIILDCWASMLAAYSGGQSAFVDCVRNALDALTLRSASGLGTWAAERLSSLIDGFGLEPANLDAVRPVIVNTAYVVKGDPGAFGSAYLATKDFALQAGGQGGVFASVVSKAKEFVSSKMSEPIEIATIYPLGDQGPGIPLTVELPSSAAESAGSLVEDFLYGVRDASSGGEALLVWK